MIKRDYARLKALVKQHPLLTPHGFGSYRRPDCPADEERAQLLEVTDEIEAARQWLARQHRIATLNQRRTSYGLKHIAERTMGRYISNGAFIAAALLDGWQTKRLNNGPNALLNISQKGLPPMELV